MGRRIIHLVRHGQAEAGDGALTDTGRTQATFTAARMAMYKFPPTSIVCSTLMRARETAAILRTALGDAPIRATKELCEGFPSRPPNRLLPPELQEGDQDAFFADEAARHGRAFRRLTKPTEEDSVVLVVAHGNVIGGFVARALGADPALYLRLGVQNCGLSTVIVTSEDPPRLVCHNDTGHLPAALLTWR